MAKCYRDLHAGIIIQHGWPAVGVDLRQFANKLSASQSSECLAALSLSEQPFEHLDTGNVVRAKLLCKSN
ncbi:hypothetical protein BHS04_21045 [Myxococcus xanthus]|nr:hypothetical protein BHS04_21045 [Myxococcus xanthus]